MEKHSFATYEFLATNNNPDADACFFVLQDNGTILTVNKDIQYITQVQEDKDAEVSHTEECAVFDVSSQQYFVDVENNTPEIITINEQFAITNEENNVYENSYLMDPEASASTEQMEVEAVIDPQTLDAQQLQQLNVEAFNGNKQSSNLTEITLSDEQYQILEHKGWLLLESNDRIFVLNTLGLHDITANEKLIQKLKNELQENNETNTIADVEEIKIEHMKTVAEAHSTNEEPHAIDGSDAVQYYVASNVPQDPSDQENNQLIINTEVNDNMIVPDIPDEAIVEETTSTPINKHPSNGDQANSVKQNECDYIKIKTKYTFTDIPEKIFLGNTANGKKLFAKVSKIKNSAGDAEKSSKTKEVIYGKKIEKNSNYNGLDSMSFVNLIQNYAFRDVMSKVNPNTIVAANSIVSQLLRVPNVKQAIVGTNLVVTKMSSCETDDGVEAAQPTIVTGTVHQDAFVHEPLLLQRLLDGDDKTTSAKDPLSNVEVPEEKTAREVVDLFHIHATETKVVGKAPQTSINLSKRKLPLDVLSDAKKRYPNPVYACGSCGAVFKSELSLKEHQNDECIEVEDELTIDADFFSNSNKPLHSVQQNGTEKVYTCLICESKFTRLYNCQKHIKAHKAGVEKKLKVYKCKMCNNTYFHSSSLSKHIVKSHIQMQKN